MHMSTHAAQERMGELLYEYTLRLGAPVEYGGSLDAIVAGREAPPPAGLRVDLPFEGEASGRVMGKIVGVDYLNIRADGRMELDLKATLTTPEGDKIALSADGVALPRKGSSRVDLRENVQLRSASPSWAWLNPLQVWAVGEADMAKGEVRIRGYLPA
jgi:hypothetical protein